MLLMENEVEVEVRVYVNVSLLVKELSYGQEVFIPLVFLHMHTSVTPRICIGLTWCKGISPLAYYLVHCQICVHNWHLFVDSAVLY